MFSFSSEICDAKQNRFVCASLQDLEASAANEGRKTLRYGNVEVLYLRAEGAKHEELFRQQTAIRIKTVYKVFW